VRGPLIPPLPAGEYRVRGNAPEPASYPHRAPARVAPERRESRGALLLPEKPLTLAILVCGSG
jgi:hypothetical protein